jgi:hypothetical protein
VNECSAPVSTTHTITVTVEAENHYIYLPLVARNFAPWQALVRDTVWKITLRNNSRGGENYEAQKPDN